MEQFAQITVDIITWFLEPFVAVLVITWVVSLFRKD